MGDGCRVGKVAKKHGNLKESRRETIEKKKIQKNDLFASRTCIFLAGNRGKDDTCSAYEKVRLSSLSARVDSSASVEHGIMKRMLIYSRREH